MDAVRSFEVPRRGHRPVPEAFRTDLIMRGIVDKYCRLERARPYLFPEVDQPTGAPAHGSQ